MKTNKILTVLALAAGITCAKAQSVTYISGSTAFQATADKAISLFSAANGGAAVTMNGSGVLSATNWVASDNATLGSETNAIWIWTNAASGPGSSSAPNLIVVRWTGSEGGIQTICSPTTNASKVNYMTTNYSSMSPGGNGVVTTLTTNNSQQANIAFSDTTQALSQFYSGKSQNHFTTGGPTGTITFGTAQDTPIAVQGWGFVGSAGLNATNITTKAAYQLYSYGAIPVSFLTGNSADSNNFVFAIGRDQDSGTRLTTLAEIGVGALGSEKQYQVTNGTNLQLYPIETVNYIATTAWGQGGYPSSGSLYGALTNTLNTPLASGAVEVMGGGTNAIHITNVAASNFMIGSFGGSGKANGASLGGTNCPKLAYNGVYISTNAIAWGQYTFWNYEHCLQSPGNTNAGSQAVYTGLTNEILTQFTTATIGTYCLTIGDMEVTHASDSVPPTSKY